MDKIILWCCLLLISVNDGFFIGSRDLRRILNFLPAPVKPRRLFHHRYYQHHNQHHHHHDDAHRHYYNYDNHYYHHHEHEIKPAPIKEGFYDDEDYDYHQVRNDGFSNNRRQQHAHHVNCEYKQNARQRTKKYKIKNKKTENVVYQKKLQDYENNDEDYDQEYSIMDNRKNRKITDNNRRPFIFKPDYVTGVLATVPQIKDTESDPEYFEHIKFKNPFMGAFIDNYGDIETQTELISEPFNFF